MSILKPPLLDVMPGILNPNILIYEVGIFFVQCPVICDEIWATQAKATMAGAKNKGLYA